MLVERRGPFGTHTNRKTGYLFAVWGGGSDSDIMMAARHKTISNAIKYKRDAQYLLHLAMSHDVNFGAIVSKWRSIFVADVQMGRKLNKQGHQQVRDLHAVSTKFVSEMCKCDGKGVLETVKAIMDFDKPVSSMDEIIAMCEGHLPKPILSLLMTKIQRYTMECRIEAEVNGDSFASSAISVTVNQQEPMSHEQEQRALMQTTTKSSHTVVESAIEKKSAKSLKRKDSTERAGAPRIYKGATKSRKFVENKSYKHFKNCGHMYHLIAMI